MDDHGHGTHTSARSPESQQQPRCGGRQLECEDPGLQIPERLRQRSELRRDRVSELHGGAETARPEHPHYSNSWGSVRGAGGPSAALKTAFDSAGNAESSHRRRRNNGANNENIAVSTRKFRLVEHRFCSRADQSDTRPASATTDPITVDLAAPGVVDPQPTITDTYASSPARYATPHVAGVAALLSSVRSHTERRQHQGALDAERRRSAAVGRIVASVGRLNAFKAVSALVPRPAEPRARCFRAWIRRRKATADLYGASGYSIVGDATSLPVGDFSVTADAVCLEQRIERNPRSLCGCDGRPAALAARGTRHAIRPPTSASAMANPHTIAFLLPRWGPGHSQPALRCLRCVHQRIAHSQTVSSFSNGSTPCGRSPATFAFAVTRSRVTTRSSACLSWRSAGQLPPTCRSRVRLRMLHLRSVRPFRSRESNDSGRLSRKRRVLADGQLLNRIRRTRIPSNGPTRPPQSLSHGGGHRQRRAVPTSAAVAITVTRRPRQHECGVRRQSMPTRRETGSISTARRLSIVGDATSLRSGDADHDQRHELRVDVGDHTTRALRRAVRPDARGDVVFGDSVRHQHRPRRGQPHTIAFYSLDWDQGTRSQRFDIFDRPRTRAEQPDRELVLERQYAVCDDHRQRPRHRDAARRQHAVVIGVFFGGAPSRNLPPPVSITGPSPNACVCFGAPVPITANAMTGWPDRQRRVLFRRPAAEPDTLSPFAYTWSNAGAGSHCSRRWPPITAGNYHVDPSRDHGHPRPAAVRARYLRRRCEYARHLGVSMARLVIRSWVMRPACPHGRTLTPDQPVTVRLDSSSSEARARCAAPAPAASRRVV